MILRAALIAARRDSLVHNQDMNPIERMVLQQALARQDVRQVLEWAAAYVDNYTAIPEASLARLTADERAGLALLQRAGVLVFERPDVLSTTGTEPTSAGPAAAG